VLVPHQMGILLVDMAPAILTHHYSADAQRDKVTLAEKWKTNVFGQNVDSHFLKMKPARTFYLRERQFEHVAPQACRAIENPGNPRVKTAGEEQLPMAKEAVVPLPNTSSANPTQHDPDGFERQVT
jgi:hypothetical protein